MAIPQYNPTQPQQAAPAQGARRQSRQRDGFPFLKWDNIGVGNRINGKIMLAQVQSDTFKPQESLVMCKVAVAGNIYMYPLRTNNPNLKTLTDAWGADENDWLERKVIWSVEENQLDGRHNIVCEPAEEEQQAKPRKRS